MKKIGIFFLVCSAYITVHAEIVPLESSTFSYKKGSFYLANHTKKRKIFVSDPDPLSKISDNFRFNGVTVYKKGRTGGTEDSTILFVGTKKGLLSRLVFNESYVEYCTKSGKLCHVPRYFKDDITENVGGWITKIKSHATGEVTVRYKRNFKSYKKTFKFCINKWVQV